MAVTHSRRMDAVVLLAAMALVALAIVYALAIKGIFAHRHLEVPEGDYFVDLTGTYQVVDKPRLRTPDVFRGERVAIRDAGDGKMSVIDDSGTTLLLTEAADGLYFSQNFSPVGARLLPGVARSWNEGRIRRSGDAVLVEGYTLEKGLALFVIPFKDVLEWRLELEASAEQHDERDRRRTGL